MSTSLKAAEMIDGSSAVTSPSPKSRRCCPAASCHHSRRRPYNWCTNRWIVSCSSSCSCWSCCCVSCSASPLALALPHVLRHPSPLREPPSPCRPSRRASTASGLAPRAATSTWTFSTALLALCAFWPSQDKIPVITTHSAFKQPRAELGQTLPP